MTTREVFLRKSIHLSFALGFVVLSYFVPPVFVALTAVCLMLCFMFAHVYGFFTGIRTVERASWGEYFFGAGVLVSALLYLPISPLAFTVSMLVLGCTDTSASLAGRRFGRHRYVVWSHVRTFEGSLAALVVSVGILYGVADFSVPLALVGGALLAFVEAVSWRGSDNLLLPSVAGVLVIFFS